jgi:hypothetical protein
MSIASGFAKTLRFWPFEPHVIAVQRLSDGTLAHNVVRYHSTRLASIETGTVSRQGLRLFGSGIKHALILTLPMFGQTAPVIIPSLVYRHPYPEE